MILFKFDRSKINLLFRCYSNPLINLVKSLSNDEGNYNKIRNIGVIARKCLLFFKLMLKNKAKEFI